jgi:hypothetical protein
MRIKYFHSIVQILVLVLLAGCTAPYAAEMTRMTRGFSIRFDVSSTAASAAFMKTISVAGDIATQATLSSNAIQFAYPFKAEQSGALVVGNSGEPDYTTVFGVYTFTSSGKRLGVGGDGETFTRPSPHVYWSGDPVDGQIGASGTTFQADFSTFVVRSGFGLETDLETVKLYPDAFISGDIPRVNEVVVRIDANQPMRMVPHFVVEIDGTRRVFTMGTDIQLNGELAPDFNYILFVPASIVGADFTYLAAPDTDAGTGLVTIPVDGSEDFSNPRGWTLKSDWIDDYDGNAGLFQMIDTIVGISDSAERAGNSRWNSLASYFQRFFTKYYQSGSTMFDLYNESAENQLTANFLLIALDDSRGPMILDDGDRLDVSFVAEHSTYEIVSGTGDDPDMLNITGNPPLLFTTSVVSGK